MRGLQTRAPLPFRRVNQREEKLRQALERLGARRLDDRMSDAEAFAAAEVTEDDRFAAAG